MSIQEYSQTINKCSFLRKNYQFKYLNDYIRRLKYCTLIFEHEENFNSEPW